MADSDTVDPATFTYAVHVFSVTFVDAHGGATLKLDSIVAVVQNAGLAHITAVPPVARLDSYDYHSIMVTHQMQ